VHFDVLEGARTRVTEDGAVDRNVATILVRAPEIGTFKLASITFHSLILLFLFFLDHISNDGEAESV
jgi:hypothetical protein